MKTLAYIKSIVIILILLSSCSSSNENSQPMTEIEKNDHISITKKQFETSDFKMGKIESVDFRNFLQVSGTTHLPEKNKAAVSSFMGGTVSNMDLIHGEWVKKGQRVFSVQTPELITWQQEYLVLQSEIEYLQSEYERQQLLSEENIAAKKQLKQAESLMRVSQAKFAGLSKKLKMIGVEPNSITSDYLVSSLGIYAPSSGYISEINVKKGMYLEPFQTAMEISNTNHIHMELKVMEKDLPKLKNGQKVRYSLQDNPDLEYEASIYLIEKLVDDTRMVNVHCHLDEKQEKSLIPGMYVSAKIELDVMKGHAIPSEAVVDFEGEQFILQHKVNSNYEFEQIQVEVGLNQNGYTELINISEIDTTASFLTYGAYYLIKGEGGGHNH